MTLSAVTKSAQRFIRNAATAALSGAETLSQFSCSVQSPCSHYHLLEQAIKLQRISWVDDSCPNKVQFDRALAKTGQSNRIGDRLYPWRLIPRRSEPDSDSKLSVVCLLGAYALPKSVVLNVIRVSSAIARTKRAERLGHNEKIVGSIDCTSLANVQVHESVSGYTYRFHDFCRTNITLKSLQYRGYWRRLAVTYL